MPFRFNSLFESSLDINSVNVCYYSGDKIQDALSQLKLNVASLRLCVSNTVTAIAEHITHDINE